LQNENAQVHVIDAITAISIIILAIIFAGNIAPVQSTVNPGTSSQLKILADDALRTLDSNMSSHENQTKLEYYLWDRVKYNNTNNELLTFLNKSFPKTLSVSYNIWYYNSSSNKTVLWYPDVARLTFGTVVRSHRIVVVEHSGNVYNYDVILEVWGV
jgi:hypothetical protein